MTDQREVDGGVGALATVLHYLDAGATLERTDHLVVAHMPTEADDVHMVLDEDDWADLRSIDYSGVIMIVICLSVGLRLSMVERDGEKMIFATDSDYPNTALMICDSDTVADLRRIAYLSTLARMTDEQRQRTWAAITRYAKTVNMAHASIYAQMELGVRAYKLLQDRDCLPRHTINEEQTMDHKKAALDQLEVANQLEELEASSWSKVDGKLVSANTHAMLYVGDQVAAVRDDVRDLALAVAPALQALGPIVVSAANALKQLSNLVQQVSEENRGKEGKAS